MNRAGGLFVVLVVLFSILTSCSTRGTDMVVTKRDKVQEGKFLVSLSGCNDCHTPKVMTPDGRSLDESRLLSGHPQDKKPPDFDFDQIGKESWFLSNDDFTAFGGGWGISFSRNLTPDNETGIGSWTEDQFIEALRSSRHLPPMPWFKMARFSDEDLQAIFAYLKTLKPIKNKVPAAVPAAKLEKER